jgi:hypothetical protein
VERRPENCKAHTSFAVQTPSPILGQTKTFNNQLHTKLLALGGIDGTQHWKDAVWLPVQRVDCKLQDKPCSHQTNLFTNKQRGTVCARVAGLFSLMPTLDEMPHWFL